MIKKLKFLKKLFLFLFAIGFAYTNGYCAFESMTDTSIRAQGMGGAFCGLSDDAHSWLINPAGLGRAQNVNIGMNYSLLYPGLVNDNISQNFIGVAYPKNGYTVGLTFANLSSSKYSEMIYAVSAAKQLFIDDLYFGINVKSLSWAGTELQFFNDQTESLNKSNFGVDFGALYAVTEDIDWGVNLINLNQPDIGSVAAEELPLKVKTGVCYKRAGDLNVLLDTEIDSGLVSGGPQFSAGLEKWFNNKQYALRGGAQKSLNGSNLSIGASYRKAMNENLMGVELAYIYPLEMQQASIMRFSILYWLGAGKPKAIQAAGEKIEIPADEFEESSSTNTTETSKGNSQKLEDILQMIKSGKLTAIKFNKTGKEIISGTDTLDKIGEVLKNNTTVRIKIESHVPPVGDPVDNLEVSNIQADKVKNYLVEKYDISPGRMDCMGWGGAMPIYPLEVEATDTIIDEEGMEVQRKIMKKIPENVEKNRRIEISIADVCPPCPVQK